MDKMEQEMSNTDNLGTSSETKEQGCCTKLPCYGPDALRALKGLIRMASPIICIQVLQLLLAPISLMFCGHLGDPVMFDAAALAISVLSCTVISIGHGMSTACDTVFSQTILSKNKTLIGIYIQKALILFSLMLLPMYALLVNLETILLYIGQHPEAAKIAAEYVLIFMPGALSFFNYMVLCKYLLSMDKLYPCVIISMVSNAVNAALHYVLMYVFHYGIRGSAIALTTAHITNLVLVMAFILISKCYKDTWAGWTLKCLEDWGPMIRLLFSGMLMVGMEFWAFELGLFLCGVLGTIELGSMSVILQLDQIWYQVPLSIQIACSIKTGQRLGAGDIRGAKLVGWLAMGMTLCLSMIPIVLFVGLPQYITSVFTNIPEIIELTADLLPLVALYVTFDGIACACKGVLTGTGRQHLCALVVFISYYLVGLPIGIPLMFLSSLGMKAYWIGLAVNMVVQAIVFSILIPCTDWDKQMKRASKRNKTAELIQEEQICLTFGGSDVADNQKMQENQNEQSNIECIMVLPNGLVEKTSYHGTHENSDGGSNKIDKMNISEEANNDVISRKKKKKRRKQRFFIFLFIFAMVAVLFLALCIRYLVDIPPPPYDLHSHGHESAEGTNNTTVSMNVTVVNMS